MRSKADISTSREPRNAPKKRPFVKTVKTFGGFAVSDLATAWVRAKRAFLRIPSRVRGGIAAVAAVLSVLAITTTCTLTHSTKGVDTSAVNDVFQSIGELHSVFDNEKPEEQGSADAGKHRRKQSDTPLPGKRTEGRNTANKTTKANADTLKTANARNDDLTPPVPDGVCIPYASVKGGSPCVYLGSYRNGTTKYHAFYWPEHQSNGKTVKDVLYLQFIEYNILPKLGWTSYMVLEGNDIDRFHAACALAVEEYGEVNRIWGNQSGLKRPIDLSAKFPEARIWYFDKNGLWKDFNPAWPAAYYMPGEEKDGKLAPGSILLGFTVERHTGPISGQQGWWKDPPYKMIFGIMMAPGDPNASPISTFLAFSDRNRLSKIAPKRRR